MSRSTPCNFCSLQRMRKRAAERGTEVVLSDHDGWTAARYGDKPTHSALFLVLTDECVCDD